MIMELQKLKYKSCDHVLPANGHTLRHAVRGQDDSIVKSSLERHGHSFKDLQITKISETLLLYLQG